jgi:hypothetical protein
VSATSVSDLSALIDKLTNSIEVAATGESFATVLTRLTGSQKRELKTRTGFLIDLVSWPSMAVTFTNSRPLPSLRSFKVLLA